MTDGPAPALHGAGEPRSITPLDANARSYDAVAQWWDSEMAGSSYGWSYLQRAIELSRPRSGLKALDVGCGTGRFVAALAAAGFVVHGLDFSARMLEMARTRHPGARFMHADVRDWQATDAYGLIIAWDSIFHLPFESQGPVVGKLCAALAPGGVLLFTAGGVASTVTGTMHDQPFSYSSLEDWQYLEVLRAHACKCVLLERDQPPHEHVVMIATRAGRPQDERGGVPA